LPGLTVLLTQGSLTQNTEQRLEQEHGPSSLAFLGTLRRKTCRVGRQRRDRSGQRTEQVEIRCVK